jgi:type VI secretion system protein ImpF
MAPHDPEIRASILDRLVDTAPQVPEEPRPFRTWDRRRLRAAVRRDLGWLLNTRCPVPAAALERQERTVINYGLADYSSFTTASHDEREILARNIRRAIEAFEPRLRDVRVVVDQFAPDEKRLRVMIEAILVGDPAAEPVSFAAVMNSRTGEAVLDAD